MSPATTDIQDSLPNSHNMTCRAVASESTALQIILFIAASFVQIAQSLKLELGIYRDTSSVIHGTSQVVTPGIKNSALACYDPNLWKRICPIPHRSKLIENKANIS